MRTVKISLLLTAFLLLSSIQRIDWAIEDDYQIRFSGNGAKATFSELESDIQFNPSNLSASTMAVQVAARTINTGNNLKDKHARGDNWLHVEKYPQIRFQSTGFRQKGAAYEVTGQLTLHGVTRSVSIPFEFVQTPQGARFDGDFSVNRQDYGIKGPLLGFVVSNEIDISLRVPVSE